jgi:hypothetical protein
MQFLTGLAHKMFTSLLANTIGSEVHIFLSYRMRPTTLQKSRHEPVSRFPVLFWAQMVDSQRARAQQVAASQSCGGRTVV